MMHRRADSLLGMIVVAGLFGTGLAGCPSPMNDDAGRRVDSGPMRRDAAPLDEGFEDAAVDAADAAADRPDAGPPETTTHVRFANFIAGTVPTFASVDVCVRPSSGSTMTFMGPLLRPVGLASGLGQTQVSRYLDLPPGTYDVAVVARDATNCDRPVLPVQPGLDLGAAGSFRTVVFHGIPMAPDAGTTPFSFRARALRDRDPRNPENAPRIRLFHVIPSPMARRDVGIIPDPEGMPNQLLVIFEDVGFDELGHAPRSDGGVGIVVDENGYYQGNVIPPPGATVGFREPCPSRMNCMAPSRISGVVAPARSIATAFLALVRNEGGVPVSGAVFCQDTAPSTGGLSACDIRTP
jgi:hypothetical protein